MSLLLDEYKTKLINKILFAASQEEVNRFIDTAITALEQSKISSNVICGFVDRIIGNLELFSPMEEKAQQWSNVKMAMILFNRIQKKKSPQVY